MSLTVQQLLTDAKRLSGRLRDHDASADNVISNAQEVLKAVDAMRQYQEDIDNLNSIAHNRPRAQLVLGKLSRVKMSLTTWGSFETHELYFPLSFCNNPRYTTGEPTHSSVTT